jgi:hypothetical protein
MFATTRDAKGQPVQINHPSHGSPWVRIRRIMVGAAYSQAELTSSGAPPVVILAV